MHSLGRILLVFAQHHFMIQGKTCLLHQVYLDFLLLHSNILWRIGHHFLELVLGGLLGLHRTDQLQLPWHLSLGHCCCCFLVTKACLTLCNPMDCSIPGFPVFHYLPEFAQTHVHYISDVIQSSYPLFPPCLLVLNLSQFEGLLQWTGSSHEVAKYWSFNFSTSLSNEYSGLISFTTD